MHLLSFTYTSLLLIGEGDIMIFKQYVEDWELEYKGTIGEYLNNIIWFYKKEHWNTFHLHDLIWKIPINFNFF